jgi:hypothetical protein
LVQIEIATEKAFKVFAPHLVRAGDTFGISNEDTALFRLTSNQSPCSRSTGDGYSRSAIFQGVPVAKVAKLAKAAFLPLPLSQLSQLSQVCLTEIY